MKTQERETMEYVKQLEIENKTLKDRILQNMLNENTEIVRLNFKIDCMETENKKLKQRNAYLELLLR